MKTDKHAQKNDDPPTDLLDLSNGFSDVLDPTILADEAGLLKQLACTTEKFLGKGEASIFLDLRTEGMNPDGAVVDAYGTIWIAQWGASRVAAYSATDARLIIGRKSREIEAVLGYRGREELIHRDDLVVS